MAIETIIVGLIIALVQLVLGLALALGSVYLGLKMFDRMTEEIDEITELKRGNIAVAILLGAIVFSIANVVQAGVVGLSANIDPSGMTVLQMAAAFLIGLVNLAIGILLSVFAIYIALNVLDRITVGIDEFKELKRGNVAVAILMAAVLFAVSFVISSAVSGMASALSPESVASAFGWA